MKMATAGFCRRSEVLPARMPVLRDCQSEIIDDFDGLVARGVINKPTDVTAAKPRFGNHATPKCSTRKNFIRSKNLSPHAGDNGRAR
jgi:hypothetical protein